MGIPDYEKLTIAQFFEAIQGREGRYELINGIAYAMAGAREGHNVICSNVLVSLAPAGKKAGCRTTSSDTGVRTGPNTVRYPDVVVDCGPLDPTALIASQPTIIVEVSSPTTTEYPVSEVRKLSQQAPSTNFGNHRVLADDKSSHRFRSDVPEGQSATSAAETLDRRYEVFDYGAKLREYQRLDSVETIMQIESEIAVVTVHRRQADGNWTDELIETFDVAIPLPSLATSVTLNEIYDTLDVRPRIRLQVVQDGAPPAPAG